MLERVLREIPELTDAVVGADVEGKPSYDITKTGAADATREAAHQVRQSTRETQARAKRSARQARKVPGVAQAEGQIKGAAASEQDLAIPRYDSLTAEEILSKLPELSQIDLAKLDSYERKNDNRTTVLSRISALRRQEPWPGYDELTVAEIEASLARQRRAAHERRRCLRARPQEPRRRAPQRPTRDRQRLNHVVRARTDKPTPSAPAEADHTDASRISQPSVSPGLGSLPPSDRHGPAPSGAGDARTSRIIRQTYEHALAGLEPLPEIRACSPCASKRHELTAGSRTTATGHTQPRRHPRLPYPREHECGSRPTPWRRTCSSPRRQKSRRSESLPRTRGAALLSRRGAPNCCAGEAPQLRGQQGARGSRVGSDAEADRRGADPAHSETVGAGAKMLVATPKRDSSA